MSTPHALASAYLNLNKLVQIEVRTGQCVPQFNESNYYLGVMHQLMHGMEIISRLQIY